MLSKRNRALLLAATLWAALAWAGPGHDHGHEDTTAQAGGTAFPRFYAISESFELVGVLEGGRLALYLDHAADNAPVKEAALELEIGGAKVEVAPHGEGEYEAHLAQPLAAGVIPVTATVIAKGESDLLAGQLDLHEDAHADQPTVRRWRWIAGLAGAVLLAAGAFAWTFRRQRRLNTSKMGGAE